MSLPGETQPNQPGAVTNQPKPAGQDETSRSDGRVGLEELAKTDRLIVQQLNEYSESNFCCKCCFDYEGENEFEVTDRFGHQIMLAKEESGFCSRQYCTSLRSFTMDLTDRQGSVCIRISRPFKCDNCCICPGMNQEMTIESPPGVIVGRVEQSVSLFSPTYEIYNGADALMFVVTGPSKCCKCCSSLSCCCCCFDGASKVVTFKIEDESGKQVGTINKEWAGILKNVMGRADRFSIDFPNLIDTNMKTVLLAATFLIDYLHFEADPNDVNDEENDYPAA